jgi:hypothetical protein
MAIGLARVEGTCEFRVQAMLLLLQYLTAREGVIEEVITCLLDCETGGGPPTWFGGAGCIEWLDLSNEATSAPVHADQILVFQTAHLLTQSYPTAFAALADAHYSSTKVHPLPTWAATRWSFGDSSEANQQGRGISLREC